MRIWLAKSAKDIPQDVKRFIMLKNVVLDEQEKSWVLAHSKYIGTTNLEWMLNAKKLALNSLSKNLRKTLRNRYRSNVKVDTYSS